MVEPTRQWTKRTANVLIALGCVVAMGMLLAVFLVPGGSSYAGIGAIVLLVFMRWWRKHAPYGSGGPILPMPWDRPSAGS